MNLEFGLPCRSGEEPRYEALELVDFVWTDELSVVFWC